MPPIPNLPRRLPRRVEQPEGGVSEADIVAFQVNISSGYGGRAQWRREGEHELLDIWFHPLMVNHLPPGVTVLRTLDRPDGAGMHPFTLVRDHDRSQIKVVQSGVRVDTVITTEEEA